MNFILDLVNEKILGKLIQLVCLKLIKLTVQMVVEDEGTVRSLGSDPGSLQKSGKCSRVVPRFQIHVVSWVVKNINSPERG